MKSKELKVRTLSTEKATKSFKGASRLYVNKDVLFELTGAYENGKPCTIEEIQRDGETIKANREATLWAAVDSNLGKAVVQMSETFRQACGFELKDQVKLVYSSGTMIPIATEVLFKDITSSEGPHVEEKEQRPWEQELKTHLCK